MEHLSGEIQSYRNIILCCQPQSEELLDKSRFIMPLNELPLSCGYEIFKMKHFFLWWLRDIGRVKRKQQLRTFPITDNGGCWVTSIIQAWQTFYWDHLTMNSSSSLAFDSTERLKTENARKKERKSERRVASIVGGRTLK